MANKPYDLIVVGGGPVGLSTAFHAVSRGWRTLVIEQFGFLNDQGSSAGASRQFRLQYSQLYMAELAIAAQTYWADLQRRTLEPLIGTVGSVWFGDPSLSSQEGGIQAAIDTLNTLNVPFTPLDAAEIQTLYGFAQLPDDYTGFFQPNGGIINLKSAERALYNAASRSGLVDFSAWDPVTGVESKSDGSIIVTTANGVHHGTRLALTPGAYVNDVVSHLGFTIDLDIWEMSSAYFAKQNPSVQYPTWFVFQKPQDTRLFYGFPEVDWSFPGYLRVAPDIPDRVIKNPHDRTGIPSAKSLGLTSHWVANHMRGLDSEPQFTSTCLIALDASPTPKELLLDYLPDTVANHEKIVTYTAGWGGKYIPILGEMVCRMLEAPCDTFDFGRYQIDRSEFAIPWQSTPT